MLPADVEGAFRAVLLPVVETRTEVPPAMPGRFCRVSVVGGVRTNPIQSQPRVLVECWSDQSRYAAMRLADQCWARIDAAQHSTAGGVWFGRIDLSLPTEYPDPNRATAWRVQFTATATAGLTQGETS